MTPTQQILSQILGLAWKQLLIKFDHKGRQDFGEYSIRDSSHQTWEVKVRTQNNRGRYLKLKRETGKKLKLRASADNYKLYDEYLPITIEEWIAFAAYYTSRDPSLLPYLEATLSNLIPKAHLID